MFIVRGRSQIVAVQFAMVVVALLSCFPTGAQTLATPSRSGTEIVGQTTVHSATGRISGAASDDVAALLAGSRNGSDFHIFVSGMPDELLEIELGFAEIGNAQPGQRIFDVDINDKRALASFDIAANAGGLNRAVIRRFTITPKRGFLDFHFSGTTGQASVNYIKVRGRGFTRTVSVAAEAPPSAVEEDPDALPSNLPAYDLETAEVIQDSTTPTWPSGFPLGGIGAGKFEILPNGEFANLTTNNSWDLPVGRVPGTFFAIGTKSSSGAGTGKILRVRAAGGASSFLNAKTFLSCVFRGIFPVAQWTFKDDKIPVEVTLEGWSSLVPQDIGDSSLPAAVLYVHLRNPRNFPISAGVAFSWEDINGRGGSRTRGDQFGYAGSAVFSDAATSAIQGVLIRSTAPADGRRGTFIGDYFIGTPVKRAVVTRQLYWDPRGAEIPWWRGFMGRMRLEKVGPTPSSIAPGNPTTRSTVRTPSRGPGAAVVCATVNLAPKERRRIPFIIAWYMPKLTTIASNNLPSTTEQQDYATTFGSSLGVASYLATNRIRLQAGTSEWHSMVLRSNLPMWLKAHSLNSLSPLISNSILLQGRRFSMLESPGEMGGMMGALDHRMAAQPFLTAMYPRLDRSELELYGRTQNENGHLPRYVGNIHGGWSGLDARVLGQDWSDQTAAWILQAASHHRATGDAEFLETIRPTLDKAVDYLEKSDKNADQLSDSGCLFDAMSPAGSFAAYTSVNRAAALSAAARLYRQLGDAAAEAKTTDTAASAAAAVREMLGAYNSSTSATFAAVLAGEWALRSTGAAGMIPDALSRSIIQAFVSRHVLNNRPVAPLEVNADGSVAKGLMSFPGLLQSYLGAEAINRGDVDQGIQMYAHANEAAIRVQFSPWKQALTSTVPDGTKPRLRSHMSTPAAWTALTALSGVSLDVPSKTLYLDPKVPSSLADQDMTIPVFTPAFWAWLDFNPGTSTGTLAVTKVFPGYENFEIERVVQRNGSDGVPVNAQELTDRFIVRDGEVLRMDGWPRQSGGKLLVENPELRVSDTATTSTLSEDVETTASDLLTTSTMTLDASTTDTATSETKYGP